jgi:predicted cobalt transporter CbtA
MDPPVPVLWACAAIFIAVAARQKSRSGVAWFFLSLVLGPLAFAALLILPKLSEPKPWPAHYTFALTSKQKWWLCLFAATGIYLVLLFEILRSQFI